MKKVDMRNVESNLRNAIWHDKIHLVLKHLKAGANPLNKKTFDYALVCGSTKTVELLLDRGASIEGRLPLYRSSIDDLGSFTTSLICGNGTPLMSTINQIIDGQDIVRFYLNRGTNLGPGDTRPLVRKGNGKEMVGLLLDRGADIEARDSDGRTPLLHATFGSDIELTKLLLDRGANPQVVDNFGRGIFTFDPFRKVGARELKKVKEFKEYMMQADIAKYSKLLLILNPTPEGDPHEVFIFQNILLKNTYHATKSVFGNKDLLKTISDYVGIDIKFPPPVDPQKDISAKFAKLEGPKAKTQESSEPPAKKLAVSSSSSGLLMEAPVPHPVLKLMGPNSLTESGSGILVPTIEGFEKISKDTPVSFSLKSIDVITDLIKLVNNPTGDNFYNLVQDSSLLVCASSFSGNECSIIPLTMSSFSIGDMMESGEYLGVSIKYLQVLSHVALNANNPLGFYGLAMANAALAANDIYEGDYANGVIHTGLLVGGIVAPVTTASLVSVAYTAYNIYEMCTELQMMGE